MLDEVGDIVQRQPGPEIPQISRFDAERLTRGLTAAWCKPAPERFVHDFAKGAAPAASFRSQLRCNVIIERERGSHGVMLADRHHDANINASRCQTWHGLTQAGIGVVVDSDRIAAAGN